MKTKRFLALALALMLALVPMGALADGGSFTLRLSDPVFTVDADGQAVTQDLTGLALQLGGVCEALDTDNLNLLLSLMVLANDDPAASGMIGFKDDEFYALASGITGVLSMSAGEAVNMTGLSQNLESSLTNAFEGFKDIEFTEGPAEAVQFYTGSGEYPRYSTTLTADQLRAMAGDGVNITGDFTLDLSYFTDDGANLRVEGVIHNAAPDDPEFEDLQFVYVCEALESGVVNMGGVLYNENTEINLDLNGAPDEQYPEHYGLEGVLDITDGGSRQQVQVSLSPGEAEDGMVADVFNAVVFDGEDIVGSLNVISSVSDAQESYWLTLSDASGGNALNLGYEGTIQTAETDRVHSGLAQFELLADGQHIAGQVGVDLNLSTDVSGKLPDISAMERVDISAMTDEQQEQLTLEGQQLLITALGKLMTVPSLATLISTALQSGSVSF